MTTPPDIRPKAAKRIVTLTGTHSWAVLMLGDCRLLLPELPKVDCVVTDPEYEIVAAGGGIGAKRQYLHDIDGHLDSGFDCSILAGFSDWTCFCSKASIVKLIQQAESQNLRWQLVTWNKTNPTPLSNGNYLPDTEYVIHAFEKLPDCDYRLKSRWILGPVEQNTIPHPTVKPLYVMDRLVRMASGNIVADFFAGSGTTGVACARLQRNFLGVEIDPAYYEIACRRIRAELDQGQLF